MQSDGGGPKAGRRDRTVRAMGGASQLSESVEGSDWRESQPSTRSASLNPKQSASAQNQGGDRHWQARDMQPSAVPRGQ